MPRPLRSRCIDVADTVFDSAVSARPGARWTNRETARMALLFERRCKARDGLTTYPSSMTGILVRAALHGFRQGCPAGVHLVAVESFCKVRAYKRTSLIFEAVDALLRKGFLVENFRRSSPCLF